MALDVGFVSLSEALDLTAPSGRALAGMLADFAELERDILRDRVKAGIDEARKDGMSKRAIARQLGVSRSYPVAAPQEALLKRQPDCFLNPARLIVG